MATHSKTEAEKQTAAGKRAEAKKTYDEAKAKEAEHRAAEAQAETPRPVQPENITQESGTLVSLEGRVTGSSLTRDPSESAAFPLPSADIVTPELIKANREADREAARVQFSEQRENAIDALYEVLVENPDLSVGQVVLAVANVAGKSPRALRDDELIETCEQIMAAGGTVERPY